MTDDKNVYIELVGDVPTQHLHDLLRHHRREIMRIFSYQGLSTYSECVKRHNEREVEKAIKDHEDQIQKNIQKKL